MRILVTGGCGFIGSNFVRYLRAHHPEDGIVVLDALTYAGRVANLEGLGVVFNSGPADDKPYPSGDVVLIRGDVANERVVSGALYNIGGPRFDAVVHFAAESHVDRSIHGAAPFVRTNVLGTQVLLDAARAAGVKRFLYMSTDEVMGDLGPDDPPFTEASPICPNSPYAASKAAGELLARAVHRTHGIDVVTVRPSNNYGAYQHPEKLIPTAILRAIVGEAIPVYRDGSNVRDWLHVEDCCAAVDAVLRRGSAGSVYCIGGRSERRNVDVVRAILAAVPESQSEIRFVADRPGHDRRYAVNGSKIERELGWRPRWSFEEGVAETVRWYRENEAWWRPILAGQHREWVEKNYGMR